MGAQKERHVIETTAISDGAPATRPATPPRATLPIRPPAHEPWAHHTTATAPQQYV